MIFVDPNGFMPQKYKYEIFTPEHTDLCYHVLGKVDLEQFPSVSKKRKDFYKKMYIKYNCDTHYMQQDTVLFVNRIYEAKIIEESNI